MCSPLFPLSVNIPFFSPFFSPFLQRFSRRFLLQLVSMRFTLQCEAPNSNLHHFKGRLTVHGPSGDADVTQSYRDVPVTMNEMLLRGCCLKNSG